MVSAIVSFQFIQDNGPQLGLAKQFYTVFLSQNLYFHPAFGIFFFIFTDCLKFFRFPRYCSSLCRKEMTSSLVMAKKQLIFVFGL